MDLSIIILNWNSRHYLDRCLASISQTIPANIKKEIIVIDNGSADGSVPHIKKTYPEVILIENEKNRGVGSARNQGLAIARGRYALILDVDVTVHENAVEILIETMDGDKTIGLCCPKLVGVDGKTQYSCREFPTVLSKLYRQLPARWQDRLLDKEELRHWDHGSIRQVGYAIGACQMIRKEAIRHIGFLDARMFYGCEEVDFCLRLWKNGWRVIYNPESVVTHVEQRLGRKNPLGYLQLQHNNSIIIYFWKHKYITKAPRIEEMPAYLSQRQEDVRQ